MIFKDERISFCVDTYLKTTITNKLLNKILIDLPKEAYNAINVYKSYTTIVNGKKYTISFTDCCSGSSFEKLEIKMQEGKEVHIFKIFYSYFNSEILNSTDLSRSFVNYEKYKIKGFFSAPQRVVSIYSNIAPYKDFFLVSCIEDNMGRISKYSTSINRQILNDNLKSYKYYLDLDKSVFINQKTK